MASSHDLDAAAWLVKHIGSVAPDAIRVRGSADPLMVCQQFDRVVIFEDRYARMTVYGCKQRPLHLTTGKVSSVYDAVRRMATFSSKMKVPALASRESCA
jgi:hypothetical protein